MSLVFRREKWGSQRRSQENVGSEVRQTTGRGSHSQPRLSIAGDTSNKRLQARGRQVWRQASTPPSAAVQHTHTSQQQLDAAVHPVISLSHHAWVSRLAATPTRGSGRYCFPTTVLTVPMDLFYTQKCRAPKIH